MRKPPVVGKNQSTGIDNLTGDDIKHLNESRPGLGTKLHRLFNQINSKVEAQAGHFGTVTLKPQTKRDARGITKPTMHLNDGRLTGVATPVEGSDAINLDYFRRHIDCNWFEQMAEDCLEAEQAAGTTTITGGVIPYFWAYSINNPDANESTIAHHFNYYDFLTGANAYFRVWSFVLTESAEANFVTFYFGDVILDGPAPGTNTMVVGLYDENRELFWSANIDLTSVDEGVNFIELDEQLEIPSGQYYLAWFNPACTEFYSTDIALPAIDIMNRNLHRFDGGDPQYGIEMTGVDYPLGSAFTPVLPDTIPDTPIHTEVNWDPLPLFFFSKR
jgi:hypothetical protein